MQCNISIALVASCFANISSLVVLDSCRQTYSAFGTVCFPVLKSENRIWGCFFKSLLLFILKTAVVHLNLDVPGEEKHLIGWFMDDKTHIFVAGSPMFNFTVSDYWNILILYAIIPKRLKRFPPPCPTYPILHLPVQITCQGEIGHALLTICAAMKMGRVVWSEEMHQLSAGLCVLACTPTVMYSRQALRTTALHNDQSLRDGRAWLQPAVLTFEVITIPKPHSPHILSLSASHCPSPICTRTHVAARSEVVFCVTFLDAARVLMKG